MFWVTQVAEYGVQKLNFRIQIDYRLQTCKARKHDPDKTDSFYFYIMKREKVKNIIFIYGLAVDTVFEVRFSATHQSIQKQKIFLTYNFNCELYA